MRETPRVPRDAPLSLRAAIALIVTVSLFLYFAGFLLVRWLTQ